jgi:hypothetical protein
VYHLELRHFPHSAWRFNLSEQELGAIVQPWVREQAVDVGERKWSPHLAKLTILEGPELDVAQLSMGRGWRSAQRQSNDVTEPVLGAAKDALQAVPMADLASVVAPAPPVPAPASSGGPAESTGVSELNDPVALGVRDDPRSLAALLGPDPSGLLKAWRAAAARSPGLAPSDSLALAERAVRRSSGDQS